MDQKIEIGQSVTLLSAHGPINRVVVNVLDGIILVCKAEEFQAARREHRDPISIGFPIDDIVPTAG
jgi:hypothetical protein